MPKVSKKSRLQKKRKTLPVAYAWIEVRRPEGIPIPKKVHEANEMLKNVIWHDPRFGPNATK